MKFSLSWLKEYIDIQLQPQQLAKQLTMLGIEVDSIEKLGGGFEKVVVARVLEVSPHPNADKLCLAKVSDGIQTYDVVCGAPNCRVGIKTALAPVSASLTDDEGKEFKVKKAKIRGVESNGMLCSGKELGLSADSDGIIEFADYLVEGADVADIYADIIFEVSLTPNLGYAASLIGIAKELAASTSKKANLPQLNIRETGSFVTQEKIQVVVQNAKDCPRYNCRLLQNVNVGQSPEWLVKRLAACGIRSINNVVDITNYVFIELGQPLHAFDYEKIEGKKIFVRSANDGENIITLDGKERTLTADMLVIADESKPIAIAGVMGGQNSEVTEASKTVILESAYFRAGSIRKTSKTLALQTDSSKRFERGSDPNGVLLALDRAAELISLVAGGEVSQGFLNIAEKSFPEAILSCRLSRINGLLGTQLGIGEVEEIFDRLGFKSTWDGKNVFQVTIPTNRVDLIQEVDLIEEVARIFGYDNIPRHSAVHHGSAIPSTPIYLFEREVRHRLISEGLQEFLTCDLIGPSILEVAPDPDMSKEGYISVLNPTSIEQSILRTSLLPGLLELVKYNYDHEIKAISGFEVGRVHFKKGDQYKEQSVAGVILSGESGPHAVDPKPREVDFYDLKGILENLLKGLNIKRYTFKNSSLSTFHTGRQAVLSVDGHDVGTFGEVHPSIQRKLDMPQKILFAEIDLYDLYKASRADLKMQPIPIYPSSERDWSVTVKEQTPVFQLMDSIQRIPSKLLEEVTLLDIFRSDKIGADLKVVTLRFIYRDREKTVSKEEVNEEHGRLITAAKHMLEAFQVQG